MNASISKYQKFVEIIYKKTVAREIKWQVGIDNKTFVNIGPNTLVVSEGRNENGEDLVLFELLNNSNNRADIFNDENLLGNDSLPSNFDNWYRLCLAIVSLSYRQATGADDVLDAMLEELDDDIPF